MQQPLEAETVRAAPAQHSPNQKHHKIKLEKLNACLKISLDENLIKL